MAEALSVRCIEVLDKMRISGLDQRPKTIDKLKNVLSKECRVTYLSSALSVALSKDVNVYLGEVSKVHMKDTEFEPIVWKMAKTHAANNGRQLNVLPCDSNLHEKLRAQVQQWVDEGRYRVLDEPGETAAKSFILDEDLDPVVLIHGLQRVGFLQVVYENSISYKLPAGIAEMEVKHSLHEYRNRMEGSFADFTVKGRYYFAKLLSESNDRIKQDYLDKVELYCEEQFAKRYPMFYKEHTEEQTRLKRMELLRLDSNADHLAATLDIPREITAENWTLLPLYLTPEVAEAAIILCGMSTKPETLFDLRKCLEPLCKITYVASPKCVLSSFSKDAKLQPKDFRLSDVNIFLGMMCDKGRIKLTDGDKLSSYIKISPKAQKKYGILPDTQLGRRIVPMDCDADSEPRGPGFENLQNFQKYVLEQAKIISRRDRASLVFNDEQAFIKCNSDLLEWIQNKANDITDDNFITSKELTDKMIHLGLYLERMPVDTVVENLVECGYIKILESKVTYNNGVDIRKLEDKRRQNEEEFLKAFHSNYKPNAVNDQAMFTSGRKRGPAGMLPYRRSKMPRTEHSINI